MNRAAKGRSHPVALDEVDHRILDLLREDARRTIADIATRVNLSTAPVKRRIDRLERCGVIAGYTVVLDHGAFEGSLEAFTEIRFTGDTDVSHILESASAQPEVDEVFAIAGDPDALVRIRADNVEHLQRVINQLRRDASIVGTKTLMVLGAWSRATGIH
jgi:DNA-binding Lrp family transcriptional regulator